MIQEKWKYRHLYVVQVSFSLGVYSAEELLGHLFSNFSLDILRTHRNKKYSAIYQGKAVGKEGTLVKVHNFMLQGE